MNAIVQIALRNIEVICWTGALLFLAVTDPSANHFTLCPIAGLGFDFCPGCDLGHSVSLFLHGEWMQAFKSHPLGPIALFMLLGRSVVLIKQNFQTQNK